MKGLLFTVSDFMPRCYYQGFHVELESGEGLERKRGFCGEIIEGFRLGLVFGMIVRSDGVGSLVLVVMGFVGTNGGRTDCSEKYDRIRER
jgi:hypothetical protein